MDEQKPKPKIHHGGGGGAIIVTGGAAATALWPNAESVFDYVVIAAVVIVTVIGIWLMHRFVARHGDEIGEARFDTRNDRERAG